MKKWILCFVIGVAAVAFSQQKAYEDMTPEEKKAAREAGVARRIARNGGLLSRQLPGGVVRVVDAQRSAECSEAINAAVESLRADTHITFKVERGDSSANYRRGGDAGAVLVFTDGEPSDLTVLVAPEQLWGQVNTAALSKDAPDKDVLNLRVKKEAWRTFALLMGAANSRFQPCAMSQVGSLQDLDALKASVISPEPLQKVMDVAAKIGLSRTYSISYRGACKAGWAPEPTNDVQRAIWEEFHAKPTEPIRIKFDKKQGK